MQGFFASLRMTERRAQHDMAKSLLRNVLQGGRLLDSYMPGYSPALQRRFPRKLETRGLTNTMKVLIADNVSERAIEVLREEKSWDVVYLPAKKGASAMDE